jgi:hypothetical protein
MPSLVDHAHQQKQRSRRHAVVDHLQDATTHPLGIQSKNSKHQKTHMADARVGNEAFHIVLRHGHQGAIQDANNGKEDDETEHVLTPHRQQGQAQTYKTIGAHLQQHASQDDAPSRWRIGMGIGEPGMEGEHRHFDGKTEEKGEKNEILRRQTSKDRLRRDL